MACFKQVAAQDAGGHVSDLQNPMPLPKTRVWRTSLAPSSPGIEKDGLHLPSAGGHRSCIACRSVREPLAYYVTPENSDGCLFTKCTSHMIMLVLLVWETTSR